MPDLDDLLKRFFDVLNKRQLTNCAHLLEDARAKGKVDSHWLDYLQAILYSEQSPPRWDLANETLQHALETDPPDELRARLHLEIAFAADYLGDYERAIEHNRLSLALFEKLGDRLYQGKVLRNAGVAHLRAFERRQAGRQVLAVALDCLERAMNIFQALGNEQLVANVELHLGIAARFLGNSEEALARYSARAEKCRQRGWQRSLALTLNDTGEVYCDLERWADAERCYTEALTILDELAVDDPRAADPYEEADIRANLALIRWAQGREKDAQAESDRAIELVEDVRSAMKGEKARIDFLGTRIRIYEQRIQSDLKRDQPEDALTILERAKSRAFIDLLAGRTSMSETIAEIPDEQASFTQVDPLEASEIQRRLPSDTLLIEYFVAPDDAGVFLVTHNTLEAVALASDLHVRLNRAFEPGLQRLRRLCPDNQGRLHIPTVLPGLHHLLIEPIAEQIVGWQRLCIVPHGALHYVPFPALFGTGSASPHYLLGDESGGPEIVYAPSATVLLDYCRAKPKSSGRGGVVFSYGDDLPYGRNEAAAVAAKLGGPWHVNTAATRGAVFHDGPNYPILHFSCHGYFNPAAPLASGLDLADGRLTMDDILGHLRLRADLVVLSGCETGNSQLRRGDELIGLVRAFIAAGTPSVLVSLWPVPDISTRILMERFYDRLIAGVSPAGALRGAQFDLMRLTVAGLREFLQQSDGLSMKAVDGEIERLPVLGSFDAQAAPEAKRPFAHPYYWAAFMLVGDRLS